MCVADGLRYKMWHQSLINVEHLQPSVLCKSTNIIFNELSQNASQKEGVWRFVDNNLNVKEDIYVVVLSAIPTDT